MWRDVYYVIARKQEKKEDLTLLEGGVLTVNKGHLNTHRI